MKVNIALWDYFSLVPIFYLGFVLVQIYDPFYRWLFASAIVLVALIEVFKLVSRPWLSFYPFMARPKGATNCNCLNKGGDASGEPGYPSSHVAIICFILLSIFIHGMKTNARPILVGIWGLYAIVQIYFVALSRLKKKCHTKSQVIAGGALGVSCAMLFSVAIR